MAKLFKNWGFGVKKFNENFNPNEGKLEENTERISFLVDSDKIGDMGNVVQEKTKSEKNCSKRISDSSTVVTNTNDFIIAMNRRENSDENELNESRKNRRVNSLSELLFDSGTPGNNNTSIVDSEVEETRQTATSSNDATTWEAQNILHPTTPNSEKEYSFSEHSQLYQINKNKQVELLQDYSEPIDLQIEFDEEEETVICKDDDYAEPEDAINISEFTSESISNSNQKQDCLNDISDSRPCEDYDKPWEWLPSGKFQQVLDEDWQENTDSTDVLFVDETGSIMTGRQRHIYETAFDSTVKHTKDGGEFEEIANHPILRNESLTSTPKTSPKLPVTAVTSREMPIPGYLTPKEKRKVTLIRDSFKHNQKESSFFSFGRLKDNKLGFRMEQVKAIVHAPPRSANSTPLLSHRLQRTDSAASSAKSTPTHYSSSAKVNVQMPVKPLSDLSLSAKASKISDGFQTLPHLSSKSSISPRVRKQTKLEMVKSISSEETLFSNASLKIKGNETNPVPEEKSQSAVGSDDKKELDPRPVQDYDPPWEFSKKKRTLPFSFSLDSAQLLNETNSEFNIRPSNVSSETSISGPIQPKPKLSLSLPFKQSDSSTESSAPNRTDLFLNFGNQSQKRKQALQLNFGCAALSVVGEKVDSALPLERQGWYHGSISRTDAENVLRVSKEGSYLIRNSESNKQDYSLSLKSARGFMHMKIVHSDGKYILGQFSKPFNSIPEMIHHYSINKLPIKGAEHMSLLYPVIDQLL